ncbi:hypothetical protein BDK51DRAFT_40396 [Blyttiomyces helicus]|uniref:Uncharacterized protein n=1 Tax=Blyttiomyces helicus TaxID=388810 RepID=A0A4P9W4A7_9FUNG|nr:hypothetical protein BDK51DRAFT_40396 [Blyttiomyces helicus]|eukprot:RKO85006.1 hypothetical protein BDK51DRAFT_40396 [Blyttiomyces helicus]
MPTPLLIAIPGGCLDTQLPMANATQLVLVAWAHPRAAALFIDTDYVVTKPVVTVLVSDVPCAVPLFVSGSDAVFLSKLFRRATSYFRSHSNHVRPRPMRLRICAYSPRLHLNISSLESKHSSPLLNPFLLENTISDTLTLVSTNMDLAVVALKAYRETPAVADPLLDVAYRACAAYLALARRRRAAWCLPPGFTLAVDAAIMACRRWGALPPPREEAALCTVLLSMCSGTCSNGFVGLAEWTGFMGERPFVPAPAFAGLRGSSRPRPLESHFLDGGLDQCEPRHRELSEAEGSFLRWPGTLAARSNRRGITSSDLGRSAFVCQSYHRAQSFNSSVSVATIRALQSHRPLLPARGVSLTRLCIGGPKRRTSADLALLLPHPVPLLQSLHLVGRHSASVLVHLSHHLPALRDLGVDDSVDEKELKASVHPCVSLYHFSSIYASYDARPWLITSQRWDCLVGMTPP